MPSSMRRAPISGQGVLTRSVMARVAYVASPIPRLIAVEVIEAHRAALRQRSSVPVVRIKAIINVAVETMRAMKPGTSPEKNSANKPIGTIVAVRSTVIWSIVEISVRAHGSGSDVYADCNLGLRPGCTAKKSGCESCESKNIHFEHNLSLDFRVSFYAQIRKWARRSLHAMVAADECVTAILQSLARPYHGTPTGYEGASRVILASPGGSVLRESILRSTIHRLRWVADSLPLTA